MYNTILKQDSLWKNHLCSRWGKRFVDDISVAEINDYLSELYYENEYAYRYVESFLKMFYLIFGQAYSRNYLDVDTYNKLCVNKDTKIHMPKLKRMMILTLLRSTGRNFLFWTITSKERTPKPLICLGAIAAFASMKPMA